MNHKLIKTEKATLLLLKLPDGVNKCKIYSDVLKNNFLGGVNISNLKVFKIPLPPGNWQPLGFAKEVGEEVAKEIIPEVDEGLNVITYPVFNDKDVCTNKALTAFHSLLQANEVYLVNPYGVQPILSDNDAGSKEETETRFLRQQAQENTGNWYILKLIK